MAAGSGKLSHLILQPGAVRHSTFDVILYYTKGGSSRIFIWLSWCSQLCNFPLSLLRRLCFLTRTTATDEIDWTRLTCGQTFFPVLRFLVNVLFIMPATRPSTTNCDLFSFLPKLIHQNHGWTSNNKRGPGERLILDLRPSVRPAVSWVHAWGHIWGTEFTGKCFRKKKKMKYPIRVWQRGTG